MPTTGRSLLRTLVTGPVPLEDVEPEARAALEAAAVEFSITDGSLHLDSFPSYGWAAIVATLDVPITVEFHDTITSTNDRARTLATAGERNVAVVAAEQTGGRGRRDREWQSPRGGVWCSVVLDPPKSQSRRPLLALAAAVAVGETAAAAGVEAGIKWPNDVLVGTNNDSKKLAGILSESGTDDDGDPWAILGIGINADLPMRELPPGATSLRVESDERIDRATTVQRLLTAVWRLHDDPETILDAWRDSSVTLGQLVRIETDTVSVRGRAVDITDTGALVLETDTGREIVSASECEHLRPD